jgi:hypothetical protein
MKSRTKYLAVCFNSLVHHNYSITYLHRHDFLYPQPTAEAWFSYGRKNTVTIFLNGQFIIVYTCKPHINHKYSLVIINPRIFSSKMLYFG